MIKVSARERTNYRWGFVKKVNMFELDTVKDTVDTLSASKDDLFTHKKKKDGDRDNDNTTDEGGFRRPFPPTTTRNDRLPIPPGGEDMDEEDLQRYHHLKRKQQDKHFRKGVEADLDELVPKASSGFERSLEKRKQTSSYHRERASAKDADIVELDDRTLMGSDESDYAKAMAARNQAMARKNVGMEQKRQVMDEKAKAFQEKEDKTMAMLKQLASRFQQ